MVVMGVIGATLCRGASVVVIALVTAYLRKEA